MSAGCDVRNKRMRIELPETTVEVALEHGEGRPGRSRSLGLMRDLVEQGRDRGSSQWSIEHDRHGAPYAARAGVRQRPYISISRTDGLTAVCASGRPVGLDVERICDHALDPALARHFFSPAEQDYLNSCPPKERVVAFFRIWTLKEAFVKVSGLGFRIEPASFSVASAGRLSLSIPSLEHGRFSRLHSLILETGHALALAVV